MIKTAEIRHLTLSKNQNHTSSRSSHLESQLVENKRTWLFCCQKTISTANSIARKMVLTKAQNSFNFLWTALELRTQDRINQMRAFRYLLAEA